MIGLEMGVVWGRVYGYVERRVAGKRVKKSNIERHRIEKVVTQVNGVSSGKGNTRYVAKDAFNEHNYKCHTLNVHH